MQSAICFEFVQIYESAKNISNDILRHELDFPLNELRGFRNFIVHEYGHVDYSIVYNSSINDVPKLLNKLKDFVKNP